MVDVRPNVKLVRECFIPFSQMLMEGSVYQKWIGILMLKNGGFLRNITPTKQ
jgi:hypothetical protein